MSDRKENKLEMFKECVGEQRTSKFSFVRSELMELYHFKDSFLSSFILLKCKGIIKRKCKIQKLRLAEGKLGSLEQAPVNSAAL